MLLRRVDPYPLRAGASGAGLCNHCCPEMAQFPGSASAPAESCAYSTRVRTKSSWDSGAPPWPVLGPSPYQSLLGSLHLLWAAVRGVFKKFMENVYYEKKTMHGSQYFFCTNKLNL